MGACGDNAKSNMHELAAGITTISSLGGQTRNPYDPSRNPGGSSGGTVAAIAASFAAVGWGSDTCGSIRIPASHNNLVGLRPSKGLSSIDGVIPLAHTQDVAGPLARNTIDFAVALDATVGYDPADAATAAVRDLPLPSFSDALGTRDLAGARLGVLAELFGDAPEDGEVNRIVEQALDSLRALGAEVIEVEIDELDDLRQGSGVIAYEFEPDLADYLAATPMAQVRSLREILDRGLHHSALESNFRRREASGTRDGEEYLAALEKRGRVREAVAATLERDGLDALVYPTIRRKAAIIGDGQSGSSCWLSANSGLPALSVPAGFTDDGLPVGLELLGGAFTDVDLLALGHAIQTALPNRRPPLSTPPLMRADPVTFAVVVSTAADGTGPESARAELVFDPIRGTLSYSVRVSGTAPEDALAVVLGRGSADSDGAALHRLTGPGVVEGSGEIRLTSSDRVDLMAERLYIRMYTTARPLGVREAVRLPGPR